MSNAIITNNAELKAYVDEFVKSSGNMVVVISSQEEYEGAVEMVKEIKHREDAVLGYFKPMKESTYKAHKDICSAEKEAVKPFEDAEKSIKSAMGSYMEELEKRRKDEEARVTAEMKAEKEKLLRKAKALEAEGKADEAKDIYDTVEAMEKMSVGVTIAGEKAVSEDAYTTKNYEITSIDLSKVPCEILNGVVIRPVDEALVKKLIRESKGTINIPGITYKETLTVCVRK